MSLHARDDEHYCRYCQPAMFPSDSLRRQRSGEDHVSSRWATPNIEKLEVYLEGKLVELVLEARAGRGAGKPGWAIVAWLGADHRLTEHVCPGLYNGALCEKVVVGQMELRYT